jgi:hypothetical protein
MLKYSSQLSFEMMYHPLLSDSDGNSALYHVEMIELCSRRQGHYFVLRKR